MNADAQHVFVEDDHVGPADDDSESDRKSEAENIDEEEDMENFLRISNGLVIIHSHQSCVLFYSSWSIAPSCGAYVSFFIFFYLFFNEGLRNLAIVLFILKVLGVKAPSLASVKRLQFSEMELPQNVCCIIANIFIIYQCTH